MRVKMQIKDLNALERACKNLGLSYEKKEQVTSRWAGKLDSVAEITDEKGGMAAVVQKEEGYGLSIDEWANSLVPVVGKGCSLLTREYTTEVVREEIGHVGMLNSVETQDDGSVVLQGVFV